jgi:hypothetical protein
MADKYTIQVNPQVSASDGQKMENELNKRFANVAKKFGTHLKNSLTTSLKVGAGAGLAGIIGMVATNPFEKVKEDLKNTLAISDDLMTRAQQFGVSTAKMTQLVAIAHSVGLDVDLALQNFASKLQEARDYKAGDKTKSKTLENFVNKKDIIENFYDFIKSVSNLPAQKRMAEIGKIYGDKMQLKIAEFAQQDIEARKKQIRPRGGTQEQVGRSVERLAALEDKMAVLSAQRFQESILAKSRVISKGTVNVDDAVERAKLNREVQNLSQFEIYARQAALTEELLKSVDQIRGKFMDTFLPALEKLVEYFGKLIDLTVLMIDWLKKIAGKTKSFFGG